MATRVTMKSYNVNVIRMTLSVITVMLLFNCSAIAYKPCSNPAWENPGYTYTIDRHSRKLIWTFCKFPNPKVNHDLCGMPKKDGFRYICDPENILTKHEALAIDNYLGSIATDEFFPSVCGNAKKNIADERYEVIIILLDDIRVPNLSSNQTCVNKCGEIFPTLNRTLRQPSLEEKDAAIETFAHNIQASLSLGKCDNEAVIIYSRAVNRVFTSFGAKLKSLFSPSNIASFHEAFIRSTTEGNDTLFEALGDLSSSDWPLFSTFSLT